MSINGETMFALQQENDILKAEIAQLRQRVVELEQQATTAAKSIDFFSMLFDTIPTPIFYKDAEGVYRGCNTAFATMLGHSKSHIIGKTVDDLAPGELAQRYHQADLELIQQQGLQDYEAEVAHADGSRHYMHFYKTVFLDERGQSAGLIGVMLDLTDRKQSEDAVQQLRVELEQRVAVQTAALKKQQTLLQAIIDGMPAAIFVRDTDGRYMLTNRNAALVTGQPPEVLIGKRDEDFFSPEWVETQKDHYQHALVTGHSSEHEISVSFSEDDQTWLVSHFPVCDEHGNTYAVGSIGLDITEQKRIAEERTALQEEIINAQQATIRELSTPLMPISDGIIMMPIIGTLDSSRAQQMMEALLDGIAVHHASTAIIDITGMKVIDTQVAQALIHTTQAVKLLGAQVILTGIQPQIATTLIHLGADLSGIMTRNSLRSGIDYIFRTRAN